MEEENTEGNEEKEEKKPTKKRHIVRNIFITLFIILLACIALLTTYFDKVKEEYIKYNLHIENINLDDGKINVYFKTPFIMKNRWCQLLKENENPDSQQWVEIIDNNCILNIDGDSKYIIVKGDEYLSEKKPLSSYVNEIISLNYNKERMILVQGEEKTINIDINYIGNPDKTLTLISENEDLLKVEGMKVIGIKSGNTNLKIRDKYNNEIIIPIIITDLVTTPTLNEKKQFLPSNEYTEEEAHILDEILEQRVNDAGLKTRAGVVAAARFITLEFKYVVPYFLENGRFQDNGYSKPIDGEGRYYKKGLYLSEDKFATIKKSSRGKPAIWGNTLLELSTGKYRKNGLDCSGFVTWALYNGGFDPGDIGAGPGEWYIALPDYGKSQPITVSNLKSGNVRAGDLIGKFGHIGIIIGIDENYIYTADTSWYDKGLVATKYTHEDFVKKSGFTGLYDMSEYYVEDGNYTNMF